MSETQKARARLSKYCSGTGLDLGFGGDPIVPWAITLDLDSTKKPNIVKDASNLTCFQDGAFDFVYSSHLLEDFEDTVSVLKEWFRIIRPGGYLVLFCPVEQTYRRHCLITGQVYNIAHKIDDFSLDYLKAVLEKHFQGEYEIVQECPLIDEYSFELVIRRL